jgi:hypothetical protein
VIIKNILIKNNLILVFDLSEKIKPYDNEKQNYILVEFDGTQFNQNSYYIIQNLSEIIKQSNELG